MRCSPVRVWNLAGGPRKLPPYLQVADEEWGGASFEAKCQGLATQVVDELPLAPCLERIEALTEQNLAALLELADGSKLRALQAGDELFLGPMAVQDAVVEADLFFCKKAPVCGL